jgi:hypothetical protein
VMTEVSLSPRLLSWRRKRPAEGKPAGQGAQLDDGAGSKLHSCPWMQPGDTKNAL